MEKENSRNIRLGTFVIAGTLFLVIALYFIGNRQNLFGSTFRISTHFYNVNGLMKGNNVRFAGIDVGTVESVKIENDSTVQVVMIIENEVQKFIKDNAITSVGTDGLMGNKLVNINTSGEKGNPIKEGGELRSMPPVEMDEMVRTLNITNENIRIITSNLRNITDKISSRNSFWNVLMDTVVADNVKSSAGNLKIVMNRAAAITGNLETVSEDLKTGKGAFGSFVNDTMLYHRLNSTVTKLETFSDTASVIGNDISNITKDLRQGKGTAGKLITDTSLVTSLQKSILRIDTSALKFNENMEALQHTWPLKKYFRKKNQKKK